jgi:hypothetical protein
VALSPVRVTAFGGLVLTGDPGDVGLAKAISVQNVEFDRNGTVRTRPGFDKVDTNTTTDPKWLAPFKGQSQIVLVGAGAIRVYDDVTLASEDSETLSPTHTSCVMGVSWDLDTFVIVDPSNATGGMARYEGTGPAATAIENGSKFLAVQQPDHRLVRGFPDVSTANPAHRVEFSGAGNYLSWGVDDYVDIAPNDGYAITMLVAWENLLFAFKNNKYAVFYGNSVDSTGGTIFNYRMVDTGVGCNYEYAACSAPDGVYFIDEDGVYRTTGGRPELVSAALQPFFEERNNGFFTPSGPLTSPRIHAGDDRLYVWQAGSTGMFVMDLQTREWTYWVLGVAPYALLPLDNPREFAFVNSTGQMYKCSPDYTDDDGSAIASHYQSGFQEIAEGAQGRVRHFMLEGSGTVSHATAVDYGSVGTSASVTLGTAPAVDLGYDARSTFGRGLSFKVSATSGAWALNRWTAHLADRRGQR